MSTLELLTERELEILSLIALAYTNRMIARELVLSEATVHTHVARMLAKLGAKDRYEAAAIYRAEITRNG